MGDLTVADAELVLDSRAFLGEGPVWDDREGVLWWLDIFSGQLHRFDPLTGTDGIFDVGEQIGAVAPRRSSGLVLAAPQGFAGYEPKDAAHIAIAEVNHDPNTMRLNDGKCDRHGRFWAGSIAHNPISPTEVVPTPNSGRLYYLDVDQTVHNALEGVTVSNGMAWSSDDRTFYFIDSGTFSVDAFDFNLSTASLTNRRSVVSFLQSEGIPDGMCIDEDDAIWVAVSGRGQIHRYLPERTLDAVIDLPVSRVTSCSFGGTDLSDLYITTHSALMTEADRAAEPCSGGLYRCRPGVRGVATNDYAG
jgi:sugar lactone lactonase YvrE